MTKCTHYLTVLTVSISSFALFQIQPLLGKYFLPWFGGGAAVWTTALFFFMSVLVVGYGYAVWLVRQSRGVQLVVHVGVVLTSLALLAWYGLAWPSPITPPISLLDSLAGPTSLIMVWLLVITIALPYSVLAATSSLVQSWYGGRTEKEPIFLYAISNLGSLVGFLSYPFLIEPYLPLTSQGWWWAGWYGVFAVSMILATVLLALPQRTAHEEGESVTPPAWQQYGAWLGYTMVPIVTLLLVTEHVTTQIAAVPLLWIIPLALYLGSFSLSFYTAQWQKFPTIRLLLLISALLLGVVIVQGLFAAWVSAAILFLSAALIFHYFHEQVVAHRPATRHLTEYYLTLSVVALAGRRKVLLSRALIPLPLEFQVLLTTILVVMMLRFIRELPLCQDLIQPKFFGHITWLLRFIIALVVIIVIQSIVLLVDGSVLHERNFYGYKRVADSQMADQPIRSLLHGRTLHGIALAGDYSPPTVYYVPSSGVGRMFTYASSTKPDGYRAALVGLGTGVLAAYCRPQDTMTFYEIDPAVVDIARNYFPFLKTCPQAEILITDGRQGLARGVETQATPYEYIIIDAYADDAVPVHLLTTEAFGTYLDRLSLDGMVAVHISSRYLDLTAVMAGLAAEHGLATRLINDTPTDPLGTQSIWVLFAREEVVFADFVWQDLVSVPTDQTVRWTDNDNAILPVIRW